MIGERIKEFRIDKKISQKKLGEMLGFSQQAVAKWESTINEPDSETLLKIANIFNIDINLLLGNEMQIINDKNILTEKQKSILENYLSSTVESKKIVDFIFEQEHLRVNPQPIANFLLTMDKPTREKLKQDITNMPKEDFNRIEEQLSKLYEELFIDNGANGFNTATASMLKFLEDKVDYHVKMLDTFDKDEALYASYEGPVDKKLDSKNFELAKRLAYEENTKRLKAFKTELEKLERKYPMA